MTTKLHRDFFAVMMNLEDAIKQQGIARTASIECLKVSATKFIVDHHNELEELIAPITDEMTTEPSDEQRRTQEGQVG